MDIPLFEGALVRLALPDPEHDAPIEAEWSHDPVFWQALGDKALRPVSAFHLRKLYQPSAESKQEFRFAVRSLDGDRLVGVARLFDLNPHHQTAWLALGIGAADRRRGYGGEALRLLLRYAFAELNLLRLEALTDSSNPGAVRFLERAGFQLEVRRREALYWDGRRFDRLAFGLLRREWQARPDRSEAG